MVRLLATFNASLHKQPHQHFNNRSCSVVFKTRKEEKKKKSNENSNNTRMTRINILFYQFRCVEWNGGEQEEWQELLQQIYLCREQVYLVTVDACRVLQKPHVSLASNPHSFLLFTDYWLKRTYRQTDVRTHNLYKLTIYKHK